MNRITKLIILLSVLMFANNSKANYIKTDLTKIIQPVNEFYDWYISAIHKRDYVDYKPRFAETENGMTSLDFSKYIENLKRYRFSDSLIIKEKESYSKCIENLRNIKFSDFRKTIFTTLDEDEEACCDFGNRYRWIGGQEPVDGMRIQDIQFISSDTVLVSIEYSWLGFDEDLNAEYIYYGGGNELIVIKQNNDWYIDKVDSFGENCRVWVKIEE
jgi:hypothetical protein